MAIISFSNPLKWSCFLSVFILLNSCFHQKNILSQKEHFSFDIPTHYNTVKGGVVLYENKQRIKGALFLVGASWEHTKFYMDLEKTKSEKRTEVRKFLLKEVYFPNHIDTSFCLDTQTQDSVMFFHYPKSMYKHIKYHFLNASDTSFTCFGYTWRVDIARGSLDGDYGLIFTKE